MRFCPECDAKLVNRRVDGTEPSLVCARCGYRSGESGGLKLRTDSAETGPSESLAVKDQSMSLASVEHNCSKCGYGKAYTDEIKPSKMNDEQGVMVYKCGRCGNVERSKVFS
ncbi:MAG: hypothetical protein KGH58_04700 [Candidatus Micrarchaeota archaeon]|nr:hypothetical protein [Candidatus Micrarchaeota archaeon]